jgi:hypothetical protein
MLQFTKKNSAQNNSKCPDLFGSKVIDLLESIPGCKKDITVNIDSGGWCYIKGEYKLRARCSLILPDGASGKKPLTIKQQADLHNTLLCLAKSRHDFENMWTIRYYRIYFLILCDHLRGTGMESGIYDVESDEIIFKVYLKCRRELAPVELLVELLKEEAYESAPGPHTAQDPSPNLELKLVIERESYGLHPPTPIYKCLIRQML